MTQESVQAAAKANLERIVTNGMANAGPVIQRVLDEVPTDSVVKASAMTFQVLSSGQLYFGTSGNNWFAHQNALGQIVARAGVPMPYARSLAAGGDKHDGQMWRRDLLSHIMREHYSNDPGRYLIRSVGDQARGFLSDRYRRLDSRPLLDSFVTACKAIDAVPYEGVATEVRTSVRAILPRVFEPVPGEFMVFGLSWHNSDYGAGTYSVNAFALRLICLNGMIGETSMKQVHLGRRLDENLEFSARTYALDTQTMTSATADIVKSVMGDRAIERRIEAIQAAHSQEMSAAQGMRSVSKVLTKSEQGRVKDAFDGPDVTMLPAGKTAWRFSNALSWVANTTEDAERKLELQGLAGKFAA
jgi:hypothetical protein